ncbi:hypothetical protein AMJ52_08515 [candidate division TA06 bacterium DG_78]|uniref:FlgD/Vpr Ig-like domain-containing protein n=1 Tax=candidate division TA06 bacterium DG_78 TaxID=1703772 RepID=A0A0S7YAV8_UNCT6|nr:MAG: hypothetical protein AMJ52_08515 [candidate division TA06 bacterium DG_78]
MLKYVVCTGMGFFLVISVVYGQGRTLTTQDVEVPFSVGEIIERVSYHPMRINNESVATDRVYDAFIIDTNVFYVSGTDAQENAAVAFDGTNYLVVWWDYRNSSSFDIYGTRVNQAGEVLDSAGFIIAKGPGLDHPAVAFDGTNYLVVWEHRSGVYNYDICGARVSPAAEVLDPAGFFISSITEWDLVKTPSPAIAFGTTNYLVVWGNYHSGSYYDISGARVSPAGEVLDPSEITISTAPDTQLMPAVAFDGTNYLVVWQDTRNDCNDIYGARVSQVGEVLDPEGIAIATDDGGQAFPAVAFDGTNYMVVCQNNSNISGARVNPAGEVLDPSGFSISTAENSQMCPAIAFDGNSYLVVWMDTRNDAWDIYGVRVSPTGTVSDPEDIVISTAAWYQMYPAIAFDGTNYLVVWHGHRLHASIDIYGTRVSQAGEVLDPLLIIVSTAANGQEFSAIAFDGTNYLVVWEDTRRIPHDIYGVRVSETGEILDPTGIFISSSGEKMQGGPIPSVAFGETNYLVVWKDTRGGFGDIYGARVSPAGEVLDPSGISISTDANNQQYPAVAFDGTNYLVVWEDWRDYGIYGARVSQAGEVLDPSGIAISTAPDYQKYPAVAFDGTNYLVVWEDARNSEPSFYYTDIYGARVSQELEVLDPEGIPISTVVYDPKEYPQITFDGANYLVVWRDGRTGSDNTYGARVSQAAEVLDPEGIAISTGGDYQGIPAVAFDGTDYLVVWNDWSSGDIHGAKVTPAGDVSGSFDVTTQSENDYLPALAHGQGSQMLITYSRFTKSINGHPANSFRIWGIISSEFGIEENTEVTDVRYSLEVLPNPFYKNTVIRFHLPLNTSVSLKIYDTAGRLVRQFNELKTNQQFNQVTWDGNDGAGRNVPAGVYFVRLVADPVGDADEYRRFRKVIKIK